MQNIPVVFIEDNPVIRTDLRNVNTISIISGTHQIGDMYFGKANFYTCDWTDLDIVPPRPISGPTGGCRGYPEVSANEIIFLQLTETFGKTSVGPGFAEGASGMILYL